MTRILVWSIARMQRMIEQMTSKEVKFDCVIIISGKRGVGKSTLGYKIVNGLNIEQPFKPKKDLVYSREDTIAAISRKINGCLLSDEMINVAYKRDFYDQDQKELLKALDMYRDSRNVFVGCVPLFLDLDTKMQKVCKIWLDVRERGKALIHTQISSSYLNDPWDLKNNLKIESKWSNRIGSKPRYGQLTTLRGVLMFGDLTKNQREEYDAIKAEKRGQIFAKYNQGETKDLDEIFITNLVTMLKAGEINPDNYPMLCKVNSKDPQLIRTKINRLLREQNDEYSFKDYCMTERKRNKNIALGIATPIQKVTVEKPAQPDTTEDKDKEFSKRQFIEGDDLLGFKE